MWCRLFHPTSLHEPVYFTALPPQPFTIRPLKSPQPKNTKKPQIPFTGTRGLRLSIIHNQNHLSVQCIRNRPEIRSSASWSMSKMSGALSTSSSSLHNMSPHKHAIRGIRSINKSQGNYLFFLNLLIQLILREKVTYD
jgi:hypothetical protein